MYIENTIVLKGNWPDIWRFSSEIEHWVRWLPHYRQVDILETFDNGRKRRAYMSAWRDILPVNWSTIQTLVPNDQPAQARVLYNHIGGVTKGMEVIWSFEPLAEDYYRVKISHDWRPNWPIVGKVAAHLIQTQIVHDIASKTLTRVKQLAAQAQAETGTAKLSLAKAAL